MDVFIVILFMASTFISNTDSVQLNISANDSLLDVDEELQKLSSFCSQFEHFEELTGFIVKGVNAEFISLFIIEETIVTIGLQEMRKVLNFGPVRPWQHYSWDKASDTELSAAPTLEAYYDLKEPQSKMRSLDSRYLYERNLIPALAFFDKRFPSVRSIFRYQFEKSRQKSPGKPDRKLIDRMIDEFEIVNEKIHKAVKKWGWSLGCNYE